MMKRIALYFIGFVAIFIMQSCSSTKKLQKSVPVVNLQEEEYMREMIDKSSTWNNITGKVSLDITVPDKSPMSVSGSIKIKRDKAILISIAPILGIEVARAEITPNGVLVIDRINKRYVNATFSELNRLSNCDFNFNVFQSLFLNAIFTANAVGNEVLPSDFIYNKGENEVTMTVKNSRSFDYSFVTSPETLRLNESKVLLRSTSYGLIWKYDDFKSLDGGAFPHKMYMNIKGSNKPFKVEFDLSRLSTDSNWEVKTQIPTKYTQIDLQELINKLIK